MKGLNVTKSEPQESRLALGTNAIIGKQNSGVPNYKIFKPPSLSSPADCPPFLFKADQSKNPPCMSLFKTELLVVSFLHWRSFSLFSSPPQPVLSAADY